MCEIKDAIQQEYKISEIVSEVQEKGSEEALEYVLKVRDEAFNILNSAYWGGIEGAKFWYKKNIEEVLLGIFKESGITDYDKFRKNLVVRG